MDRENQAFRFELKAGYADSFNGRRVQPSALMAFLEEAAAGHCESIGQDVFSLLEEGQGWVLTGGFMNIIRYPDYGERIIVETWISEWKRFSGIREYRISTPEGVVLCEAGGRWVYWDIRIRKPLSIPEVFRESWFFSRDSPYRGMFPDSATPVFPELSPDSPADSRTSLRVRRGDVDLYGHLHNTSYMDWLMEAVPDYLYRDFEPQLLEIRFFSEAVLGDEVVFSSWEIREGLSHEVRRKKDGKLLARGYTVWIEKRQGLTA